MNKRNIYQNQCQELLHLFEEAGSSAKVMCVPMDYAKKDHLVMFCNGQPGVFLPQPPHHLTSVYPKGTSGRRAQGVSQSLPGLSGIADVH